MAAANAPPPRPTIARSRPRDDRRDAPQEASLLPSRRRSQPAYSHERIIATHDRTTCRTGPTYAAERRRIGWWGTATRITVSATLVLIALTVWQATPVEVLIGLVVLPAVATALMLLRDRASKPLRLGAAGHLVTAAHVAVRFVVMPEAAAVFYGSTALVAALHGNAGCEITAVANWLRDRPRSGRLPGVRNLRCPRRTRPMSAHPVIARCYDALPWESASGPDRVDAALPAK